MKIAYLNAIYKERDTSGGNAHRGQFIKNAVAQGHEIWTCCADQHPAALRLQENRNSRLRQLKQMDAIYVRIEHKLPNICRWTLPPRRERIGAAIFVWEFNVPPEYGKVKGRSDHQIRSNIAAMKHFGAGCDLAICVSDALSNYVEDKLELKRIVTVSNGSDPKLFRPDITPVRRIRRSADMLNVVWIGSAYLRWHNFELLWQTARLLWTRRAEATIQLHVIGAGLSQKRTIPPNVSYHGPVLYHRLPYWLGAMDIGLVLYHPGPSQYGSPLKLFDYMASGLAVVGSYQPQLYEVFEELNQTDLVVANNDPHELATRLLELSRDRDRVRTQGRLGRASVIKKYNWRRTTQCILNEMKNSLTSKRDTER